MPGPLHAPLLLVLYPFRFRDALSGRWVRARYVAERDVIAARHAAREITGTPELRSCVGGALNPWKRGQCSLFP